MLRNALFAAAAVLLSLAAPFRAAAQPPISGPIQLPETSTDEEEGHGPRFISLRLALFGTAGTYAMTEFNENIDELTIVAREQWGAPEIKLDRITGGIGGGVGLHAFFRDKIFFAAEYEQLTGTSNVGGRLGRADMQVPATAVLGTLGYCIYSENVKFGFAVGGGRYEADGSAEFIVDEETVEKYSMKGDTIGQHYVAFVDTPILGHFRITAMVGYRGAKIDDPEVTQEVFIPEEEPLPGDPPPPDRFPIHGDGSSLDWSGFMARIALAYVVF